MQRDKIKPILFSIIKHSSKEELRHQIPKDIVSGVVVAVVALPLSIALGIASGVSPEQGLYTAIVAGFLIAFLGGSRVQISGPTAAFATIVAGIVATDGIEGLIAATIIAGILLIFMGLFKLGALIRFVPFTITTGFTAGIAVTLTIGQLKDFFGLTYPPGTATGETTEKLAALAGNFSTVNGQACLVGVVCLAVLFLWPRVTERVPSSLMALLAGIALVSGLGLNVCTIGDLYVIDSALPTFHMPHLSLELFRDQFANGVTIAILAAIESLLSCVVADSMISGHHRANMELVAQGVGNIASVLFGGIPATGAIARTMTNINNGGKTPVAGLIHAAVLLLILLCLGPLTRHIPMACLAGVLVIVAYNMSEWRTFRALMSNPKADVAVLLVTFLLTVLFDLTVAIEVGLVIACLLFMRRVAETTNISVLKDEIDPNADAGISLGAEHLVIPEGVEVYEIDGPFFFGIANKFEEQMVALGNHPQIRIIRMRKVPFIDSTGIHNLTNLCRMSKREGVQIILSGVNPTVHRTLEQARFYDLIGKENICSHIDLALEQARKELAARHPGKR